MALLEHPVPHHVDFPVLESGLLLQQKWVRGVCQQRVVSFRLLIQGPKLRLHKPKLSIF